MRDEMSELFKWDQDMFLQNLFISLDTSTLRRCREVSKLWRDFIDRRVWGCSRLRPGLIVRLWKDFQPVQHELVVGGSVTSIACDDQIIVCGYTDGDCEVFSNVPGTVLMHLVITKKTFITQAQRLKFERVSLQKLYLIVMTLAGLNLGILG